jgi:hypothetical protein
MTLKCLNVPPVQSKSTVFHEGQRLVVATVMNYPNALPNQGENLVDRGDEVLQRSRAKSRESRVRLLNLFQEARAPGEMD